MMKRQTCQQLLIEIFLPGAAPGSKTQLSCSELLVLFHDGCERKTNLET
jgi:hypothetical protein